MTDFRALCEELLDELELWSSWHDATDLKDRAGSALHFALAEQPVGPTDEKLLQLSQWHQVSYTMCDGCVIYPLQPGTDMRDAVLSFARAVWDLAVSSQLILDNSPQPPADGEVARFAGWLRAHRDQCVELGRPDWAHMVDRAAELLEQQS
jgi:hypothetical protein